MYPHLAKIAKRVFTVPASCATVECEFSLAGETVDSIIFQHSFGKSSKVKKINKIM